jgi:hypothetical protein
MKPRSGELYACGDDVIAYRGGMVKKVGVKGSPVKTVRDWAHHYAASPKTGKEFRFQKVRWSNIALCYKLSTLQVISGIDMPKIRDGSSLKLSTQILLRLITSFPPFP